MSGTPFIDRCGDLYLASGFYQREGQGGRPLAFLVDYKRYSWLKRESPQAGLEFWPHGVAPVIWDPMRLTLHGFDLYVGPWAPPDGVLFLPEPTIRSMVGLWGPRVM